MVLTERGRWTRRARRLVPLLAAAALAVGLPLVVSARDVLADPMLPAEAYESAVLADDPISYYRLEETSGSVAADERGVSSGAIAGEVMKAQPGAMAGSAAMSFDGSDGRITLSPGAPFYTADYTVEAWLKIAPGTPMPGAHMTVLRQSTYGMELDIEATGPNTWLWASTQTSFGLASDRDVRDGVWHHVVATKSENQLALYLDGSLLASAVISAPSVYYGGGWVTVGQEANEHYFKGLMDELAYYDHALPPERVLAHWCASSPDRCEPVASAGPDVTASEGGVVSLDGSGSTDPNGDTLTYDWSVVSQDGPPVTLTSSSAPVTSFRAPDDGVYRFRLRVTDGTFSDTDDVTVTVVNAVPTLMATASPAAARGLALVSGSFTDAGFVDTHDVAVDWGDGTPVEELAVTADGGSAGSFVVSHQYAQSGAYAPEVTMRDDDGGSATQPLSVEVARPVALWADAATGDNNLLIAGTGAVVTGLVHSNSDVDVAGVDERLLGGVEYRSHFTTVGTATVDPPAVQVASASPMPVSYALGDYRPGGQVATAVAPAFTDLSPACTPLGVTLQLDEAGDGVYWSPCPVVIAGEGMQRAITVVADAPVTVTASTTGLVPFVDGLLVASTDPSETAVTLAGNNSVYAGVIYAPEGRAVIAGNDAQLRCGVYADRITLGGTGWAGTLRSARVDAGDCRRNPDALFLPPVLAPRLASTLAVDTPAPLPGDTLGYTATCPVSAFPDILALG